MGTDIWGIDDGYEDALGKWHLTGEATRALILKAMGVDPKAPASPPKSKVRIIRPGQNLFLNSPGELILEDGSTIHVEDRLPSNLPFGYHRLYDLDGKSKTDIIASPGRCYLPKDFRIRGWAVQLYSLRSAQSWGIGDFGDLKRLAQWSIEHCRAGILLVNPLHAATPVIPQEASPYFPSSRLYRNILYIRVEDVPGASEFEVDIDKLAAAGRALDRERYIDRNAIFQLKLQALERLWSHFQGEPSFVRYCTGQGEPLKWFSIFCVLAEQYGRRWRDWPAEYRRPDSPAVRRFAEDHGNRIRFHHWLQWLLDQQLAKAVHGLSLMQDLPIGFDPDGADAWTWQDLLANDMAVGAPPDEYNTLGQNWRIPPFIPNKLRGSAYEPFRQMIRASLHHSKGLRIDHVMGLFRLFWIPNGADPSAGAFVRYAADDLLAIVDLESHRANALIVGEDLGTVEKTAKRKLSKHQILSYRLLWFEKKRPSRYPKRALAAATTHDLPTIAGLWSGADLRKQQELGLNPNEGGIREIRNHLRKMTGLGESSEIDEVIKHTYRLLAEAPSMIITATLEDVLGVKERPNMPNTTTEWPNWSMALPKSLEAIETDPLIWEVARILCKRRNT